MPDLTIASYNIHWGRGPKRRGHPPFDVVAACRRLDADVLVLQEIVEVPLLERLLAPGALAGVEGERGRPRRYRLRPRDVFTHSAFGKPDCPGFALERLVAAFRRRPDREAHASSERSTSGPTHGWDRTGFA